jgi:hypothetical protein
VHFRDVAAGPTHGTHPVAVGQSPARGQPLTRQRWPFETVGHYEIVQEWRILFPYFVFLMDETFFDLRGQ